MPRQTRHESELEVYRKEIIRLEKALREIRDCKIKDENSPTRDGKISENWCRMKNIAALALDVNKTLNPQQKG